MPFLTIAGENKLAQNQSVNGGLTVVSFVLANIPDLGAEPADRVATMPDPSLIVDTIPFTKRGYVNPNQVVYSLVMGSNIGDYDFNWIGLVDEDGVLVAVSHIPTIQKRKNVGGIPGNTITRNFLLKYTGIQEITATTIPVETWQIDFSDRLIGIDERERLANLDVYGHEGFLSDGWKVTGSAGTYSVAAGIGYVGGVRAKNAAPQQITTTTFPNEIWLNVSLQGDISDMNAVCEFVIDTGPFADYVDSNGIEHYLTKIANIASNKAVTDSRVIYDPRNASNLNAGTVSLDRLPATENPTDTSSGLLMRTGDGGWLGKSGSDTIVSAYPTNQSQSNSQIYARSAADYGIAPGAVSLHMATEQNWGRLRVNPAAYGAWIQGGNHIAGTGWTAELYHDGNLNLPQILSEINAASDSIELLKSLPYGIDAALVSYTELERPMNTDFTNVLPYPITLDIYVDGPGSRTLTIDGDEYTKSGSSMNFLVTIKTGSRYRFNGNFNSWREFK